MRNNVELLEQISKAFFNLRIDIAITKYICTAGFIFVLAALDALSWPALGCFIGILLFGKFLKVRE